MSDEGLSSPSVDQFAEELVKEPRWYEFGVFLGVPTHELDTIGLNYRQEGTVRCLIEMYKCLESKMMIKSWADIAEALSRLNNSNLSNYVYIKQKYLRITPHKPTTPSPPDTTIIVEKEISKEFKQVHSAFIGLELELKNTLRSKQINVEDIHFVAIEYCEIEVTQEDMTIDRMFVKLRQHYCFLNHDVLIELIDRFLNDNESMKKN